MRDDPPGINRYEREEEEAVRAAESLAAHAERMGFWERKRLLIEEVTARMSRGEITEAACQGYVGDLLLTISHEQLDEIEGRLP